MKLSTKLLIGLTAGLTGFIIWQVIISNLLLDDIYALKTTSGAKNRQEVLTQAKTFKQLPCTSFSHLVIEGNMRVEVLKGTQSQLFVNKYGSRDITFEAAGDTLKIMAKSNEHSYPKFAVYLFVPQNLASLELRNKRFIQEITILGVEAEQIKVTATFGKQTWTTMATDMPKLNINHYGGDFSLKTRKEHPFEKIDRLDLNILSTNGEISINDVNAPVSSMYANIKLENGFVNFSSHEPSGLKTLHLTGTLQTNTTSKISASGRCDSLVVDVTGFEGKQSALEINNGIAGQYERITVPKEVSLVREEKK